MQKIGIFSKLICKNKLKFIVLVILFSIIIFPVIVWPNILIGGGDVFFPINFRELLERWRFSWIDSFYLGIPAITYVNAIFPSFLYGSILQSFNLPMITIQKLWFALLILLACLSIYYLSTVIRITRWSSLVLVVLSYILSPFYLHLYNPPQYPSLLAYSLLPLYLGLYIKGLNSERKGKYIAFFSFLTLFSISVSQNISIYVTLWIIILLYFLFHLLLTLTKSRSQNVNATLFTLAIIIIALLVNSFWLSLLPFYKGFLSVTMNPTWVIHTSVNAKIINIIRMVGSWNFWSEAFGSPIFTYASWYKTPLGIYVGIIIFIISSLSLLAISYYDSVQKRNLIFFQILLISSIFLAKGSNPPLGEVYLWLYSHIQLFAIFREPFTKFEPLLVLSVSVLIGYSCEHLNVFLKKTRLKSLLTLVIASMIVIYGWSFFTGDIIPRERGYFPGRLIIVPDYWIQASQYIEKLVGTDHRVLLLPKNPFYQMHYFWWGDGYYGEDPARYLILKPIVSEDPKGKYVKSNYSVTIINKLYGKYIERKFPLWKSCAILNIKYILHRKDLDWTHLGKRKSFEEPKAVETKLHKEPYIRLVASFGKFDLERIKTDQWFLDYIIPKCPYLLNEAVLDLYEVDSNYTLPHIYALSKFTVIADVDTLFKLFENSYDPRKTVAFTVDGLDMRRVKFLMSLPQFERYNNINNEHLCRPILTFKKINPTKYIVAVENATQPFFLVFSESYHPQWRVYIEDELVRFDYIIAEYPTINVREAKHDWYNFTPGDIVFLFKKPAVNETLHFIANGYANAWYIDPKEFDRDSDGKFTIIIYFLPQSLFYLGLFISGITLLSCIGYLFYDWRRERGING